MGTSKQLEQSSRQTPLTAITTTTSWDTDTANVETNAAGVVILPPGTTKIAFHCTEDVYIVIDGDAAKRTSTTLNGVSWASGMTYRQPVYGIKGAPFLHYKAVSAGGTLTITAYSADG